MRKRVIDIPALILSALLLLGAAPAPGSSGETMESRRPVRPGELEKNLSREEDKSLLPQDVWTDVESEAYWERLLAGIKDSGDRRSDLANVAFSQLGYRESTLNMDEDWVGDLRGYTRYGAWYGAPYGDWCAMFSSFCIRYAGIAEEEFPYEANCEQWSRKLAARGLYQRPGKHTPQRGDVIFFGEGGVSTHVGIIWKVRHDTGMIDYIHGNSIDKDVSMDSIEIRNGSILGYGVLPPAPRHYPRTVGRMVERAVRAGRIE